MLNEGKSREKFSLLFCKMTFGQLGRAGEGQFGLLRQFCPKNAPSNL